MAHDTANLARRVHTFSIMHATSLKTRKIRELLHNRRMTLLSRYYGELDRAGEGEPSPELIDTANDQWDARVLSTMSEGDATKLEHIAAALRRLDSGRYGICARCGHRITADRLRVLPEAAECAGCATFAESRRPRWVNEIG